MKFRVLTLLAVLFSTYVVAGHAAQWMSGRSSTSTGPTAPVGLVGDRSTGTGRDAETVRLDGLRDIEFGDTEQELTRRGVLTPAAAPCGPRLAGLATASPVFADERLVLLWMDPPLHTPEGVTAGTPVRQVRHIYPDATALTAPAGSYRYDGLLVRAGDRAYLFLHDGTSVRKIVAGYADYAQKLFHEGFGVC